jgi:phosphate transport system substrate-binding protein
LNKAIINRRAFRLLLGAASLVSAVVVSAAPVLAGSGDVLRTTPVDNTDQILNISGSSTVYPFIDVLEEQFEALHSGWDVQTVCSSSGEGSANLDAHLVDIANCSSVKTSGSGYTFTDHLVARDAVCIVVSDDCTLTDISRAQLVGIYEGSITNWSELGWASGGSIEPVARVTTSGTRAAFLDLLKTPGLTEAEELATIGSATRMETNGEMVTKISTDAEGNAIGYVGVGYSVAAGMKALTLEGQAPTVDNIINKTYTGCRYLHEYTISQAQIPSYYEPMTVTFINFVLSDAGQKAVEDEGFVTILPYWDPNGDNAANIGDVAFIGLKWNQSGANGWCREDVNDDGSVNIGDVATLGLHWNQTWAY